MLDWNVVQIRHEEMLREAEAYRRIQALAVSQRSNHNSLAGILNFVRRTFASAQSAVPQPNRIRSRKI